MKSPQAYTSDGRPRGRGLGIADGGGTGMNRYEFKGGNGTASRRVRYGSRTFTVGVCVQADFGSRHELTVAGRHVGPQLAEDNPLAGDWFEGDMNRPPPSSTASRRPR